MQKYLNKLKIMETKVIAPNTKKIYDSLLRSYESYAKIISSEIGEEFQPYPLDEQKVRVFLEWYREHNEKTTYWYLRLFVTAFTFHLNQKQSFDFTKNYEFKSYLKGLKREMLGGSSKNAKKFITPEILISLASNVNLNKKKSVQLMSIYSLCYYGF